MRRYPVVSDKYTPEQLQAKLDELGKRYDVISVTGIDVHAWPVLQYVIVVEDRYG